MAVPPMNYALKGSLFVVADFSTSLDQSTTPEEFDNFCNSNKDYRLDNISPSYTALSRASEKGNSVLIRHIVSKDRNTLNCGDNCGATPLVFCIYRAAVLAKHEMMSCLISDKTFLQIPALLCSLGTDVNLKTRKDWGDSIVGDVPKEVNALWMAAEKTTNPTLIKMLLIHGACVCGTLSEQGQAIIARAKTEISNETSGMRTLCLAKQVPNYPLMPDMINLILTQSLAMWYKDQMAAWMS